MQSKTPLPGQKSAGLAGKTPLYGKCDGHFALTTVPSAFAQSLLPPDLELAPQQYAPAGYHPIMLMFNNTWLHSNEDLERITKEYHLQLNLHYNEFIVMLPFAQFKDPNHDQDGPYCFLPVLYLDSILAVLGGRIFWEFNKEMARFDIAGNQYNVMHELTNTALFSSEITISGPPVIDNSVPNFNAITPILDLPVLEYGIYGYVSSVYTVAYKNAIITPATLQLTNHSCKYLPPGLLDIPSIEQNEMGCFNLQYNWTLSFIKFIKL